MRAALLAIALCLPAVPALAVDPWAGTPVVTAQAQDPTGGSTVVAAEQRSGFGADFANSGTDALGNDVSADTLNAITPAAGESKDDAGEAATIEPAAGTGPIVVEDDGEPVEFTPEDKENKIIGP